MSVLKGAMQNWYDIFPKNTGLSAYIWVIFCLFPFYFIFRSSSIEEIIFGISMILLFFLFYRLSFVSKNTFAYFSISMEMVISIIMTVFFGFVYFSLFLAFFIGNLQSKAGFLTLYIIHLITTISAVVAGFYTQPELFMNHFPFIGISLIGVILLPFNIYNKNKREKLEGQLESANIRISQLMVSEERQRIARDLHDTLGQKLSLIGLKSDLAGKLISKNPEAARNELQDINQTARTALKEVREMVSNMKGAKLEEELFQVQQMLEAAELQYEIEELPDLEGTPLLVENVLSMCLKEAVTNVVRHSQASYCKIEVEQSPKELTIYVKDNGIGLNEDGKLLKGYGLQGMKERLEFVNGELFLDSNESGTVVTIKVPKVIQQVKREGLQ